MSVWLVGAGCGPPGLLTLAASECLSRADHVVYDRLIHPDLLQLPPPGCGFHSAGKRENAHTMRQDEINELLASLGRRGGTVVRLKGGDPFVFGRGGEEAEFLERHGVPWRVIPGVTAAVSGAAAAGLTATRRGVSSSLLFVTGHRRGDADDDDYWREAAAARGTAALYMGAANFAAIAERLAAHGKSPSTPVAVVRWAGWGRASRTDGTLAEIAAMARRGSLPGPAIIYVGDAAEIELSPEAGPLRGMQVVICRPYPECWNTGRAVEALSADCYGLPLLEFEDVEVDERARLDIMSADWLVVTSPRGAARLARLASPKSISGKVAALGAGTASALKSSGIVPEAAAGGDSRALARLLGEVVSPAETVVFARNERASDLPVAAAREKGARVKIVPTYRMRPRRVPGLEVMREQWEDCGVDAVVFGSSAMAEAYGEVMGTPPENASLIAWGRECGAAIRRLWNREPEIMPSPGADGLIASLIKVRNKG
jgi:uroporphyrinogen III methyltransferase/synthase